MRMSPGVRCGRRSLMVVSTPPAGTISQTARGVSSFFTRSAIDAAPTALARVNSSTAFGDLLKTTHWWPPARSRRAMLAPMRPSPIIPICIADSLEEPIARRVRFRPLPGSGSFAGGHRGRRRSPIPPPARRCPHPLPDRTQDEAARSARAPVRSWAGSSGGIVQGKVGAQNRGGQLHSSPVQISGSPSSPSGGPGPLEDVHELAVSTRDLGDGVFPRALLGPPRDERLPEVRASDGEADEPGDAGGRRQPLAHLLVVFAAAQDDAADLRPATPASGGHDPLAVLAPVEPLDLPDVGLDPRVLELLDRLDHQPGTEFYVVGLRVPTDPVELQPFRGHQQLEHEPASALVVQVLGESLQARRLSPVQRWIALRVIAHQDLAKRRLKGLDMLSEVLAVLEVELVLPALLGGTRERIALGRRIAEDGSTELLVHEDARPVLGDAGGDGGPEAVVDHLLGDGDLRRLLWAQRALPAEHLCLERPAVVEGEDIERPVEAYSRHRPFLSFR